MDAQQFLAEFGHIANAPGGVARLRELVLRLAVQGRLVRQSDLDEPAEDFLSRSLDQTRSLARRGSRATITAHARGTNNLPYGWISVSLGRLANPQAGFAFKASLFNQNGIGLPIIRVRDVGFNAPATHYSGEYRDEFIVTRGDWLVAMDGDFRVAMWESGTALLNQRVTRLQFYSNEINKKYVCIALQFELRKLQGVKNYTTVDHLSGTQISESVIALPPQSEQSRIVAKVEELMALCDKLESQHQARRKLQNNLRQSTLQAVASATSPHELQTTWTRLAENFGQLFHAPEDVDEFVAELKNIAVRGLLSLPSTSPSPVGSVVADCDSLRDQYITSGLMRRQKLISVADSDVVYPDHWAIVPFNKVAVVIGGVTKGRNLRGRDVVTCPYLAVANVQRGFFKLTNLKTIQIGKEELNKYLVKIGDLLITEGGDWDKVGRTAIWQGGVDNCLHQNHVFKARVPSSSLLNEWVELVFNSGIGRDYFAGASKQTTNLASINMTQLRSFPMPIPPLDEQRAVLSKLDALTEQAVNWREKLERKQRLASLLAGATVATFTGIAIEQEEEPMKAPQTELIAPLLLGTAPDIKAQAPLATILARHNGEMSAKDLWQRFGGEIDAFYAQLKTEVAHGWILEPTGAEMREKQAEAVSA